MDDMNSSLASVSSFAWLDEEGGILRSTEES
jgi:hypothetical protein